MEYFHFYLIVDAEERATPAARLRCDVREQSGAVNNFTNPYVRH